MFWLRRKVQSVSLSRRISLTIQSSRLQTQKASAWKATNISRSNNLLYDRVDRRVAETQVFLEDADVATLTARLRSIETETNEHRRNLYSIV
jgi:hypothetical protein